jgi:hypothetical protein
LIPCRVIPIVSVDRTIVYTCKHQAGKEWFVLDIYFNLPEVKGCDWIGSSCLFTKYYLFIFFNVTTRSYRTNVKIVTFDLRV